MEEELLPVLPVLEEEEEEPALRAAMRSRMDDMLRWLCSLLLCSTLLCGAVDGVEGVLRGRQGRVNE